MQCVCHSLMRTLNTFVTSYRFRLLTVAVTATLFSAAVTNSFKLGHTHGPSVEQRTRERESESMKLSETAAQGIVVLVAMVRDRKAHELPQSMLLNHSTVKFLCVLSG
jgi:hypothetical protein